MYRQFRSLVLVVALGSSVGCAAGMGLNVYDQPHRDYHRWNDGEEQVYRSYLAQQHQEYREYRTLDRPQQNAYWTWRHNDAGRNKH